MTKQESMKVRRLLNNAVPRTKNLLARMRRFFTDNPDEELKYSTLMEKFDCSRRNAEWAVAELTQEGLTESVRVVRNVRMGVAREVA